MNFKNIKIALASILFLATISLTAQETVTVPLSNPSKAGYLKMGIINGSITVNVHMMFALSRHNAISRIFCLRALF